MVAVALLGMAVALAAVSPAGALGAVVLAVPTAFEIHPFLAGSYSLLELGILATAAGLAVRLAIGRVAAVRDAVQRIGDPVEVVVPAGLILASAILAYAMMPETAYETEALREIRLVIVEPLVFLGCALVILSDRRARWYVWSCAAASGAAMGAWAVLELVAGNGIVLDEGVRRATAIYSHPNNLALFLERTLLLTVPFLLRGPWTWPLGLSVALQAAGIAATVSRGALLAVLLGTVVSMLLLGMRRPLAWLLGAVVVGGALLILVARERVFDAGGTGVEPTRLAIWRSSLAMALDHPLFGVGPDQFLYHYSRRYVEPAAWPERYTSHPHMLPLDIWLRTGVAGLASFAALLTGLGVRFRATRQRIVADPIAVGAVAALTGGAVHGLVDNGFFLPDLAVLTWLAIALLVTAAPPDLRDELPGEAA